MNEWNHNSSVPKARLVSGVVKLVSVVINTLKLLPAPLLPGAVGSDTHYDD